MSLSRASLSTEPPTLESMTQPRVREGHQGVQSGEEGVCREDPERSLTDKGLCIC